MASTNFDKPLDKTVASLSDAIASIDYYTLLNGEEVTSTLTTKTLYSGRKVSDYKFILAVVKRGTLLRASMFIPSALFGNISLTEVDSSNVQRWYEVKYASDTSVTIQSSSNASAAQIWLYGFMK